MGIPFPEEYGGAGADTLAYALTVEELARVDSSVAITLCAHSSLGTQPIYLFGTEEQKREWLPRLTSGERLAAFGLTEPEAGSDAGNTRTRARLDDGEWVIDGAKQFITNAGTDISGLVTITARRRATGPRSRTFSSPTGRPATRWGSRTAKMGWHASDTRPLSFADCRVPEANLLGAAGSRAAAVPAGARHRPDRRGGDGGRASRRARSTRRSPTRRAAMRSAGRSRRSRRSAGSSPTCRPRSRRHGCSPTRRRG